jgi:hypothetical protein
MVRVSLLCALVLALAACPKNVPQDMATGEDGKSSGAREMKLENNEARSTGIVTYPGGDRVDWKVIELPKDKVGTIRFKLKWTPPRPGLDLSFDVLNEYFHVVGTAKPNKRKKSRKTNKVVTVENAKGKLFVAIYASERGDAGKYSLTAEWKEFQIETFDWLAINVDDPPKLPAVPENEKGCDQLTFDAKVKACLTVCPIQFDPKWPGCAGICPTPPDPALPACQGKLPCPTPPDRAIALCTADKFPPCDPTLPPAEMKKNPNCDGYRPPDRIGEVTDVQNDDQGGGIQITINLGTADGVDKGWKGVLLDSNDKPIRGSEFKVSKVTKNVSVAKVKIDASKLAPNNAVRLSAP